MIRFEELRGRVGVLVLACALGGVTACDAIDSLITVDNPERILADQLNDKDLVEVLTNSVVGELQDMYDGTFISRGSMFTDEQLSGINDEGTARLNQRIVRYDDADNMFSELSEFRMTADSVSFRLRNLLETPDTDARLAQTLAYAGYGYVLMGEAMCEATFDVGETIYPPAGIFEFAIPRFEEALEVAQAAGDEDIANLARVGLARAYLNIGGPEGNAKVMEYAAQVPQEFVWWAYYELNAGENTFYGRTHGNNHSLGVHPHFLNGTFGENDLVATQTDPRLQHTPDWDHGHNGLTKLYKPFQGLRYSGFNGETIANGGEPAEFERDTDIMLASGLEALHHYYEAAGPNGTGPAGSTLDFVNSRRAYGNQPPLVNPTDAELVAELREQRGLDLYLGGFRLGDLRRWGRLVGDEGAFFPQGQHPVEEWGQYGKATCFPLPLEEYEGNPNITDPHSS